MDNRHLIKFKPKYLEYIEESYKDLFDENSDIQVKLIALDLLANYISDPDVRKRIEHLYSKETEEKARICYRKILNGEYKTSLQYYREIEEQFETSSDEPSDQQTRTKTTETINKNIRFLRSFKSN